MSSIEVSSKSLILLVPLTAEGNGMVAVVYTSLQRSTCIINEYYRNFNVYARRTVIVSIFVVTMDYNFILKLKSLCVMRYLPTIYNLICSYLE